MPVGARKAGRLILVSPQTAAEAAGKTGGAGLYARVSSQEQKCGLDGQVARLSAWAAKAGLPVVRVEAAAGSGMNGLWAKACRLLTNLAVAVVVAGHRDRPGRVNTEPVEAGYPTAAERHAKTVRVQTLRTRLADVEQRLESGRVSVCRGGKNLLRKRCNLADAGLTETGWRERWEASRLFLTADGEKHKTWGNETIRWNPDQNWLEIRLPTPLAHLANRPHGRSVTGSPVWPPAPAWPSSRWTRLTRPAGGRSTGSPPSGSITPSSPATTRQRW